MRRVLPILLLLLLLIGLRPQVARVRGSFGQSGWNLRIGSGHSVSLLAMDSGDSRGVGLCFNDSDNQLRLSLAVGRNVCPFYMP